MTALSRRTLLIALAAIGAGGGADVALAQDSCTALDLSAGREIGAAWRAAHPDADLDSLRADLLPDGACRQALARLGARARDDFGAGRVFIYRGWRLSETEAQLFALAAGT
jgi:hypothetical protein